LETTDADARAAIAMLREGLKELDFKRLARTSSLLVRAGVLEPSHGMELSKPVGFLRHLFHHVEDWESGHATDASSIHH
jgi:hypothetical protein